MIKKIILCDRCGGEIEEEHPTRIQIQEYDYSESKSYGRYAIGYRTNQTIHLCEKCKNDFTSFLGKGGESLCQ